MVEDTTEIYTTKRTEPRRTSSVRAVPTRSAIREPAGAVRIFRVRTYSHAVLTWAVVRSAAPQEVSAAAWGASGATLPDLPLIAGAAWLVARRRRLYNDQLNEEVCAKGSFAGPDAALHSAILVGGLLVTFWTCTSRERKRYRLLLAFLWGGPVTYSPTRLPTRRTRGRSCGRSQRGVCGVRSLTGIARDTPAHLRWWNTECCY